MTPPAHEKHAEAERLIDALRLRLSEKGVELHPAMERLFEKKAFFEALPNDLRNDAERLAQYAEHGSRLMELLHDERVYGEWLSLPRTGKDGRVHAPTEGQRVNLNVLRELGCDPEFVLAFRVTEQSDTPKPEPFWTTDYFETQRGLHQEIPEEQRAKAVTLMSDLATLAGEAGLVRDINDDSGLAIRQIDMKPFNQKQALAILPMAQ